MGECACTDDYLCREHEDSECTICFHGESMHDGEEEECSSPGCRCGEDEA